MTTTLFLLQGLMIFVLVGIGNNLFVEMLSMDVLPSSSSSNSLLLHQRSSSSSSALRRRSIRRRDRSNSHQIISMTTTMMMMISGDDDADYAADPDDDDVNRDRDEKDNSNSKENENEPLATKAVIKMDDGGSDLTNRFKYKVNALMGKFDPPPGNDDNERQDGNILNAMLKFPVRYTFNVVGKVSGGDSSEEEDNCNNDDDNNDDDDYVEQVKKVILDISGDDNGMICKIIPRGTKFVKLNIEVEVLSTTMINTIYEDIGKLDNTVMKF